MACHLLVDVLKAFRVCPPILLQQFGFEILARWLFFLPDFSSNRLVEPAVVLCPLATCAACNLTNVLISKHMRKHIIKTATSAHVGSDSLAAALCGSIPLPSNTKFQSHLLSWGSFEIVLMLGLFG